MKIRINGTKNFTFTAILLLIATILPINGVVAEIVTHLYEIEMPVVAQSRDERTLVVREALKEILVRVSGRNSAEILAEDEILVAQPTRLVQQFRYRKFKSDEIIPAELDGAEPYTQKLWLRFNSKAIKKLLRDQGLPVWGKTRPATLVWLVVDDQKKRVLVGNSTPHISRTHIANEAVKRGLPFRLPLLDLADQSKLQVTDVWGNFEDTILAASQRYQTESILVGRVYLSFNQSWNARWSLYSGGQRQDWEINNSETLQSALRAGLANTAESLSLRFAQLNTALDGDVVSLKIKGITDLKGYNKASKYLKSLSLVSKIHTLQVNKSDVIFNVTSRSSRLGLAQAISLGRVLVAEIGEANSTEASNKKEDEPKQLPIDLVYKLVP